MILLHLVAFKFFGGASASDAPPEAPAVSVGGGWIPKKRRTVKLNGLTYIGTEDDIEALVAQMLQEPELPKPVKAKKTRPVEIEIEEAAPSLPERITIPVYKALLKEAYKERDAWLTYTLREILRRYEEEEDDLEVILWSLH